MAKPKIGIVDVEMGPSGMTRYVLALLELLDREQFQVVLFCRHDGPYRNRVIPGVEVVYTSAEFQRKPHSWIKDGGGFRQRVRSIVRGVWLSCTPKAVRHLVGFLRDARRMKKLFRAHPIDLVHVQVVGDSFSVVGARWAGIPAVIGTHHLDPDRRIFHQWAPEFVTSLCLDKAIAVSEGTRSSWAKRFGVDARRLCVIPNGVGVPELGRSGSREDARARLGLPAGSGPVAVVVGRLEEQKGHRFLFEAFADVIRLVPDARLIVVGDGSLRAELEGQVRTLSLQDRVSFLGHCTEIQSVLDAADVFVLPSLWEAMPFAALEAMASALPVVATDVGGVSELICDGANGYLVPPADAAALAARLGRVLASPDERRKMGNAGRSQVERHFTLRSMIDRTQHVYQRLLSSDEQKNCRRRHTSVAPPLRALRPEVLSKG